jgi:hypothetical protein
MFEKICRQNRNTFYVQYRGFPKIVPFIRYCGNDSITWRIFFACRMPKATHTHTHTHTNTLSLSLSEYLILYTDVLNQPVYTDEWYCMGVCLLVNCTTVYIS